MAYRKDGPLDDVVELAMNQQIHLQRAEREIALARAEAKRICELVDPIALGHKQSA